MHDHTSSLPESHKSGENMTYNFARSCISFCTFLLFTTFTSLCSYDRSVYVINGTSTVWPQHSPTPNFHSYMMRPIDIRSPFWSFHADNLLPRPFWYLSIHTSQELYMFTWRNPLTLSNTLGASRVVRPEERCHSLDSWYVLGLNSKRRTRKMMI